MRIGAIAPKVEPLGWLEWRALIERADDLGIDAVLLPEGPAADPLLLAAAIADTTSWIRVVAEVEVTPSLHPVHLAERIAVADQCLAGRLIVVLRRPDNVDASLFRETLEVLELALTSRPFSYAGAHWSVPAQLAANDDARWSQVTVTPSPRQFQFPLWLSGSNVHDLAYERGYVWLSDETTSREKSVLPSSGVREEFHPAMESWVRTSEGQLSASDTSENLRSRQKAVGLDLAFLPISDHGSEQVEMLAALVRPRVQLADLPPGLEEFWQSSVPADSLET